MADKLVRVGALKGPHGLKGMVKAKIGLEDYDLLIQAGPLYVEEPRNQGTEEPRNRGTKEPRSQGTQEPRTLKVLRWQAVGQGLVALEIEHVTTIEQAETLRNVAVSLMRSRFPEDENAVYLDALEGADVVGPDGTVLGHVEGWNELPAGPALNVRVNDSVKVLPLNDAFVSLGEAVELTELGVAVLAV